MDNEITNMLHLGVFREIPRPDDKNIITPKWVFRRKFEDGLLVKHKARLVARGFPQVSGIDYHDAYLYAPVVRLKSFRVLISIADTSKLYNSGSSCLGSTSGKKEYEKVTQDNGPSRRVNP